MTNKNKLLFKIFTKFSKWTPFLESVLNFARSAGLLIILIVLINLIDSILKSKSINLLQPFYYKIFFYLSISILSICTLDYLIKFIITTYYYKNKEVVINKNYPKFIYNYLYELKVSSELGKAYSYFYLYSFFIYLAILVFIIFTFIFLF